MLEGRVFSLSFSLLVTVMYVCNKVWKERPAFLVLVGLSYAIRVLVSEGELLL